MKTRLTFVLVLTLAALPLCAVEPAPSLEDATTPTDLATLLGEPSATAAAQSCQASWDCRWGADVYCSCPGAGTCSSSPGSSGFGEVTCACGTSYTHLECFDPT